MAFVLSSRVPGTGLFSPSCRHAEKRQLLPTCAMWLLLAVCDPVRCMSQLGFGLPGGGLSGGPYISCKFSVGVGSTASIRLRSSISMYTPKSRLDPFGG